MAITTESKRLRREANRLLAQVERQGVAIVARYHAGEDVSGRHQDFRRFVEQIDHFHVFVDLVEERLPQFEDGKRQALEKHLAQLRWRIIVVEVDTTQVFLVRIVGAGQPWPLGSRQFLERRLNRLTEITEYFDRFGERYQLPPLTDALLNAVGGLLKAEIVRAPALEEFSIQHQAFVPPELRLDGRAPNPVRQPKARVDQVRVAPQPAAARRSFRVREIGGRFYAERDSIVAVSEACRDAKMSMDQLAQKLGMSRPSLVLLLNGNDPIQRGQLDQLRAFVGQAGAAGAA